MEGTVDKCCLSEFILLIDVGTTLDESVAHFRIPIVC